MLSLRHRRRRVGERGQTLVLALAFLVYFAIFAAAVLSFAAAVQSQRNATEKTAARDSLAQGSAQFALSDTQAKACGAVTGGSVAFGSDTIAFNKASCAATAVAAKPGSACVVCVLNSTPANARTTVISGDINVNGEVDANGTIDGSVQATKIGVLSGGWCADCIPRATTLSSAFADPLAGTLASPTAAGPAHSLNSGNIIQPGVYSSITADNPLWFTTGVYVVTGQVNVGSSGVLENSDSGLADSDSGGATDQGGGGSTDGDTGVSGTGSFNGNLPSTMTDNSKNWANNQWVGAVLYTTSSGRRGNPTQGTVTASGSHTLTVNSWSNGTPSGFTAYVVSTISYTSNTLTDSAKNWAPNNVWAKKVVTVTLSDGSLETDTITSSTAHTLTMASNWTTTPVPANSYVLASDGYTTSTLVDASKAWVVNTWAKKVVTVTLTSGTLETGIVASNTGNTLTMSANWATTPSPGNTYTIATTGYTPTALVDGSKAWTNNQWVNASVIVTDSKGVVETRRVTANTASILTVNPAWTNVPSPGAGYSVSDVSFSTNSLTDTSKGWISGQWVNALVTVTMPNHSTETATVKSNTANSMTVTANWATPPPPGSIYTVVAQAVIYLACASASPTWTCAAAGQSGGNISIASSGDGGDGGDEGGGGGGGFALLPYQSGPYAGVSVFSDPNLTDPGGSGEGDGGGGYVIDVGDGGQAAFNTVYTPRGTLHVSSNGTGSVTGRLVVQDLIVDDGASLDLSHMAAVSAATCYVYNTSLYYDNPTQVTAQAHVQFETNCAAGGLNGKGAQAPASIINFAFGNGP